MEAEIQDELIVDKSSGDNGVFNIFREVNLKSAKEGITDENAYPAVSNIKL